MTNWKAMLLKTEAKEHADEIAEFFVRRGIVNQETLQNAPKLGHIWGHDIYALVYELNMLFAADLVDNDELLELEAEEAPDSEAEVEEDVVLDLGNPAEEEE